MTTKQPDDQAAAREAFNRHCQEIAMTSPWRREGFLAGYQAAAEQRSEQPAAEVDDAVVIDGMTIEGGSTIMAQARHNTEVLTRLGILDENGDPKLQPAEPLGDVCECLTSWAWKTEYLGRGLRHHPDCDRAEQRKPAPNPQAVEADRDAVIEAAKAWLKNHPWHVDDADAGRFRDEPKLTDDEMAFVLSWFHLAQLAKTGNDVDLRTALAYEAGQQAERIRIADELMRLSIGTFGNFKVLDKRLVDFIETLREETNAK